jgi:SAM-dependent methyltransferase
MKEEIIGKVKLNYTWYSGEDLYSDGDAVENRILDIVRNEEGYEYALDEYTSWPILYHLTRQRENIVLPMEISKTDEVLEVGAGMGAITGALARTAKKVDCIELSKRRSYVNAERHKDLDNIEIFVGNFRDIHIEKKYDAVVLIGVMLFTNSSAIKQFLEGFIDRVRHSQDDKAAVALPDVPPEGGGTHE